jgi:predicted metal-binding membrane protein
VSTTGLAVPAVQRLRRPTVQPAHVALGLLTAAAWLLLAASGHLSPAHADHGAHAAHMSHEMASHDHRSASGLVGLASMTVAMMTTGLTPMVRYVRERSLRRRWWSTPTVLLAYFAVWLLVGIVVSRLVPLRDVSSATVVWLLLAAAVWQLTPAKRWAARACERPAGLQLRGFRASRSEVVFGLHQGAACVASCWVLMAPMLIGAQPALLLMVTGTAVVTMERIARRPTLARRGGAALLVVTAIAVSW